MRILDKFIAKQDDNVDVARVKFKAFVRQATLSYVNVILAVVAAMVVVRGQAHFILTMVAPLVLIVASMARVRHLRRIDIESMSADELHKQARSVFLAAFALALFCALGCVGLLWSGAFQTGALLIFAMTLGVQTVIVSLMHFRSAALVVNIMLTAPASAFFLFAGDLGYFFIGLLYLTSAATFGVMTLNHSQVFDALLSATARAQTLGRENNRIANEDALTGLATRRSFFAQAKVAAQSGEPFAIVLFDLDGFKPINDLYGHTHGDDLLQDVGRRLCAIATPSMTVARLGGDEFAILAPGGRSCVEAFARSACAAIAEPFQTQGATTNLSASAGYACFPDDATSAGELYECADCALYQSKDAHHGAPIAFTAQHREAKKQMILVGQLLHQADLDKEFSLVFQPIFDARSRMPVGFEALARWNPPGRNPIPPDAFIAGAERNGLILPLTRCLFRKALAEAALWPPSLRLSFNLSIHDISSPEATLGLIGIISASGVDPRRVTLEITETSLAKNFDRARASIVALKGVGVSIALDDFGMGYSSLSYIEAFPFDEIKLDRAFANALGDTGSSAAIVRAMIQLCGDLTLESVMEGVETAEQAAIAQRMGCTRLQGYFLSRPLDAAATRALAEQTVQVARSA